MKATYIRAVDAALRGGLALGPDSEYSDEHQDPEHPEGK
jgi:hypothetical protein